MGFFDWLTGKKNAPATNTRVMNVRPAAPAANMMVAGPTAAPAAQFGGRKRTRKASKGRKGRRASRRVQRGGCKADCWEPRLKKCVC